MSGNPERSSERELNPMERWNVGILGAESGESAPFASGALRLKIASLREEAKNSWPSASSPLQADVPPTFFRAIPIHEPIIPVFPYSNILAGLKMA